LNGGAENATAENSHETAEAFPPPAFWPCRVFSSRVFGRPAWTFSFLLLTLMST